MSWLCLLRWIKKDQGGWRRRVAKGEGKGWSELISDSGWRCAGRQKKPTACSETLTAMGAQSPNWMSKKESIRVSERWDLYPQGYRGQKESKDLQDRDICGQRGTSRFLLFAVTGPQMWMSRTWFIWMSLCTGTSSAREKSDVNMHIQSDRGYGSCLRTGHCMLAGIRRPSAWYNAHHRVGTWVQDVAGTPADFLKSCRITFLSLEPLLCG